MRSTALGAWIFAITSFASLTAPWRMSAEAPAKHQRYKAIDLGTLGDPNSSGCVPDCRYVNNAGAAIFRADTSAPDPFPAACLGDCFATLGVKWQNGAFNPLNPLPGGGDAFPAWINDTGVVSGYSENGQIDPATGFPEILATLWREGLPANLGTFGGNASLGWAVNNAGHVVGGALNSVPDAFANAFFNYSFFPFPSRWKRTHSYGRTGIARPPDSRRPR